MSSISVSILCLSFHLYFQEASLAWRSEAAVGDVHPNFLLKPCKFRHVHLKIVYFRGLESEVKCYQARLKAWEIVIG